MAHFGDSDVDKLRTRRNRTRRSFLIIVALSFMIHCVLVYIISNFRGFSVSKKKMHLDYMVNLTSLPMALSNAVPDRAPKKSIAPPKPPKTKKKSKPKKRKPPQKKSVAVPAQKRKAKPTPPPAAQESTDEAGEPTPVPEEDFTMGTSTDGTERSGSMSLDTQHFPYSYYLLIVRDKIARNWLPPLGTVRPGETKTIVLHFIITRSGKIVKPQIEESSGHEMLDQSTLRAVLVSNPFPPLPFGFSGEQLGIHFRFICSR